MPKIKKWHDIRKTMPLLHKTCLIQTGEHDYRIATLEAGDDEKGGFVIFMDWEDNGGYRTSIRDVQRWAYIYLD